MFSGFLIFMIVVPIAGFLVVYRYFNNGNFPCVNTSGVDNIRVGIEEV